jgi:hypothetical protein
MKKTTIEQLFIILLFIGLGVYKVWNTTWWQPSTPFLPLVGLLSALTAVYVRRLSQLYWCYKWGDINLTLKGIKNHYPIEWIDWIGLVVFLFFQFGWGQPLLADKSVKNPHLGRRIILIATGLSANLLLAFLALAFIPYTESFSLTMSAFLKLFAQINLHYFLVSLIPYPPFDLCYLWQSLWNNKIKPQQIEIYGLTIVFIVILTNVFPRWLQVVSNKLLFLILA